MHRLEQCDEFTVYVLVLLAWWLLHFRKKPRAICDMGHTGMRTHTKCITFCGRSLICRPGAALSSRVQSTFRELVYTIIYTITRVLRNAGQNIQCTQPCSTNYVRALLLRLHQPPPDSLGRVVVVRGSALLTLLRGLALGVPSTEHSAETG